MWYKQSTKDRIDLMMKYRKTYPEFSYHDMVEHFNSNPEKFGDGGKVKTQVSTKVDYQYNNPSETVNQQQRIDPYTKASYVNRADQLQQEEFKNSEEARILRENRVRARIKAQNELDKKNKVAKSLYDEDFETRSKIKAQDYNKKIEEQTNELMLNVGLGLALPIAGELAGARFLPNAYKLNPMAYKGSDKMLYRGLGEEGFKDAAESGVFRAKQNVESQMLGNVNLAKKFDKTYYTPKFDIADSYANGYIAEVPESSAIFKSRYSNGKDWSQYTSKNIPINEGKIYKNHWLRGAEEVTPSEYNRITQEMLNKEWLEKTSKSKVYPMNNKNKYLYPDQS